MHNTGKFVLRLSVVILVLLFISACQPQQQIKKSDSKSDSSVRLYVDAVSLASAEPNQAVFKLNEAITQNPRFAMAYSLLGSIYYQQNKFPESAQAYKKAVEINPWSYEDYRDLGRVYRSMEDFNSAAKAFSKACQLDPQSSESYCAAADSYYKLGDYEAALQYGQSAKGLAPNDSEIEKLLGDIYAARQDNDLAIESYKKAIELSGSDPNLKVSLAVAFLRAEQYDSARQLLEAVAAAQPDNAEVWRHLGFTYLKLNKVDISIEDYSKAVQLAPNDWRGQKGLGVAQMMKYQQLTKQDDPNADSLKTEAMKHWSKSLDLNPAQDKLLKLYRRYK